MFQTRQEIRDFQQTSSDSTAYERYCHNTQQYQIEQAFRRLVERSMPWLLEVGRWIFGGLIAFNLLLVGMLTPTRLVDPAILVATAACAFALPLNVTGSFLVRLAQDLKHIEVEKEVAQVFHEVGFSAEAYLPAPTTSQARQQRRLWRVLFYSSGLLALSMVLTLSSISAALWHMAWWISVGFVLVMLSQLLILVPILTGRPSVADEESAAKDGGTAQCCSDKPGCPHHHPSKTPSIYS